MPIAVEVTSPAKFAQWVASKGGHLPGAKPAAGPDSTAATQLTPTNSPPAAAQPQPPQAPSGTAVRQPATNQASTAQN
jgi:cytochrome c oxidase subunit 2